MAAPKDSSKVCWLSPADDLRKWRPDVTLLLEAFEWYEARLRTNNAVDFDDLLSLCIPLLRDEVRQPDHLRLVMIQGFHAKALQCTPYIASVCNKAHRGKSHHTLMAHQVECNC